MLCSFGQRCINSFNSGSFSDSKNKPETSSEFSGVLLFFLEFVSVLFSGSWGLGLVGLGLVTNVLNIRLPLDGMSGAVDCISTFLYDETVHLALTTFKNTITNYHSPLAFSSISPYTIPYGQITNQAN